MFTNCTITIEELRSKKTGKPYTAVVLTLPNGQRRIIGFGDLELWLRRIGSED